MQNTPGDSRRPGRLPTAWEAAAYLVSDRCDFVSVRWLLRGDNMLGYILLIVLILVLLAALPTWPYSASWGYGPTGVLGLILIILLVLVLMGRI